MKTPHAHFFVCLKNNARVQEGGEYNDNAEYYSEPFWTKRKDEINPEKKMGGRTDLPIYSKLRVQAVHVTKEISHNSITEIAIVDEYYILRCHKLITIIALLKIKW